MTGDLTGKKIGLVKEGFDTCDEDVVSIVKIAANKMRYVGAAVEDVSIPLHADGMWFNHVILRFFKSNFEQ